MDHRPACADSPAIPTELATRWTQGNTRLTQPITTMLAR